MEFPKTYRTNLGWAMSAGAIIALIAGKGILVRSAIIGLVIIGAIGATWVAWEHKWLKRRSQSIVVVFLIWGGMSLFCWWVWPPPPDEATRARIVVTTISFRGLDNEGRLHIDVNFKNGGPVSLSGMGQSEGTMPSKGYVSEAETDRMFNALLKATPEQLEKEKSELQPGEGGWFTMYAFPTPSEYQEMVKGIRVLYIVIQFTYHDHFGPLQTEYCAAYKNSVVGLKCDSHNQTRPID